MRAAEVVALAGDRDALEAVVRERYRAGELSHNLDGLRALVEGSNEPDG